MPRPPAPARCKDPASRCEFPQWRPQFSPKLGMNSAIPWNLLLAASCQTARQSLAGRYTSLPVWPSSHYTAQSQREAPRIKGWSKTCKREERVLLWEQVSGRQYHPGARDTIPETLRCPHPQTSSARLGGTLGSSSKPRWHHEDKDLAPVLFYFLNCATEGSTTQGSWGGGLSSPCPLAVFTSTGSS